MRGSFGTEEQTLLLGALLHDIGKFKQRAEGFRRSHQEVGAEWVREVLKERGFDGIAEDVAEIVLKHHEGGGELIRIVKEADGISSSEREELENESPGKVTEARLLPVLADLGCRRLGEERVLPLTPLRAGKLTKETIFPQKKEDLSEEGYEKLWDEFDVGAKHLPNRNRNFQTFFTSLYYHLYQYTWSVPSAAYRHKPTISLFDHLRTTAAIALCLYRARGEEKPFLFLKGDISGIQRFIYRVASPDEAQEKLLKRLRGRSFYVQLLTETVARRFMGVLSLPETNLVWIGGGNFTLLVPNTEEAREKIEGETARIEKELLEDYHGSLGVVVGTAEASSAELRENLVEVIERLEKDLSEKKLKKFATLEEWPEPLDIGKEGLLGECPICGAPMEKPSAEATGEARFCKACRLHREIGEALPDANYLYWFDGEIGVKGNAVIRLLGQTWVLAQKELKVDEEGIVFQIGESFLNAKKQARGFKLVAKHVPKIEENTLDFEALSERSQGAPYLAAFRADVDDLGYLLMTDEKQTLSRFAAISRSLSFFYDAFLETLVKDKYEDTIYIIYTGGDDVFVVGSWDRVLEFAKDLNREFREYVCGNPSLHISAGYEIFKFKEPIGRVAERAGERESVAKEEGKNRIWVMGKAFTWQKFEEGLELAEFVKRAYEEGALSRKFVMNALFIYKDYFPNRVSWRPLIIYQIHRNVNLEIYKDRLAHELAFSSEKEGGMSLAPLWASVVLLKTRKGGLHE